MNYPAYDPSWKSWGRITSLHVQGPHLVIGTDQGLEWKVVYREDYEVLKLFDWVALTQKDEVILVALYQKSKIASEASRVHLKNWMNFTKSIRLFFENQKFLELSTPTLVLSAGTEPSLDHIEVLMSLKGKKQKRFLPTSPELYLKKALTLGFSKIFEIAKVYRDGEVTRLHQPEFWMLEWYRSFSNLEVIQTDLVKLISHVNEKIPITIRPRTVKCYSVAQLFKKFLNVELTPDWTREQYSQLCSQHGLRITDDFKIDDLFFILMLEKIEPQFNSQELTFVENYPPFQAALARKNSQGWAERFELYWQGMELANAFHELNDPKEQRTRAIEDLQKRALRQGFQFDGVTGLDEEFFQSLESGLPPSAGIAVGLDRLFMALFGIDDIKKTRLFSVTGT
ncbi:MAG: amino acid--tRNA ligase-related protein [Bdellovibrionales bacterium]